MTTCKPTLDELEARIGREMKHYNGKLPDRVAVAWSGYIAALFEWGLISIKDFDKLSDLIPVENDPVAMILQGRYP